MQFKAYALTNEIDLNRIAVKCSIPKKYTWEEPLVLHGETLSSILGRNTGEEKVLVFSFGSVVFINTTPEDTIRFVEYIKSFKPDISMKDMETYTDDYEIREQEDAEIRFTDKFVTVPGIELFYPELVSIVIAKSVALEKSEEQLEKILDRLEVKIERFEKGNLTISNRELAKTVARIIRHEYNTIAYIMILDKPDITWVNSQAASFYDRMSDFFELNDRYETIKKKSDILNNIMEGFSSISHSMRSLLLEWIIIILIVAEVILMVIELLK